MNTKKFFELQTMNHFYKQYNIDKPLFDNSNKFRHLCFKLNYFMKQIQLPQIAKESLYEAVFIEFRSFPHIEFIIRNTIYKLGKQWAFTIICGSKNYSFIKNISISISKYIKIIPLNYENMTQQEYSNFLMTTEFWNLLTGDKILIYQEDSLILKQNINPFLKYDFIGAPFPKHTDDTPSQVGNGGFSIRNKAKMLEVIQKCPVNELVLGQSTQSYMNMVKLTYPPEDIYFSKNMQEYNIGDVADWETASNFSSESVFNPNSFGCHKLWISNEKWIEHIESCFQYDVYKRHSNIKEYLIFNKKSLDMDFTHKIPNAFDIDLYFFCKVNSFDCSDKLDALIHFNKNGFLGFIYHPKQILNFFPKIHFFNFLQNIYLLHDKNIYSVQDFVNRHFYHSTFEYLCELSIKKKYDSLNDNYDFIILVFIGNETIGLDLISKIIQYKKKQKKFNVAFCFNNKITNFKKIKMLIQSEFDFYAIYISNDYGTDITPTLIMYNDIIKKHRFRHIIKLHTKSVHDLYLKLTDYLLSYSLNSLIKKTNPTSNCIGYSQAYTKIEDDIFNKKLIDQHKSKINKDFCFVAGTIFYTRDVVFDKVLEFVKTKNYRSYLLNNLYENNSINVDYSPIHFIERLFGILII